MEPQQLQDFNERLSQWISNQGFWFQVRYSMAGSGVKGRLLFHFLKISFRLLIFLLIVAAAIWVLLVKRTDSPRFVKAQQALLQEGLSATDLDMRGYRRSQGKLEISRLAASGGDQTFFSNLELRNVRCDMGLIDGLVGTWNPGVISIARLELVNERPWIVWTIRGTPALCAAQRPMMPALLEWVWTTSGFSSFRREMSQR